MKCRVCGGTGTSNTCVNGTFKPCTFCDGTGEYEPFDLDVELDKLYPPEQTNEEWFDTLSTEEKVAALVDLHKKVRMKTRTEIGGENSLFNGDYHREWLKEIHHAN